MSAKLGAMFSSFRIRNYRLFFIGQLISSSGIWVQQIAVAWLVLDLTNSAFAVGLTIAFQTLPYLLFGAWAGVVVDRFPKRRLLLVTQIGQVVPPMLLWTLTTTGSTKVWMVYALTLMRGFINAFDNPARQSFLGELVDRDRIVNAVSLNASLNQGGRLFGPAIAAGVIATLGLAPCFFLNGASYVFMALMVLLIRERDLFTPPPVARGKRLLRAGFSYVARTPDLRGPLMMMGFVGLLAFNFNVVFPTVARFTYHGSAGTYALMMNFVGGGALVSALSSGLRVTVTRRTVALSSLAFGLALGATAVVDNLVLALICLIFVGAASVAFSASVQSLLQLTAEPDMRGRVLSLYQVLYQGTTPLGALIVGALASTVGARSGLVLGAVAGCLGGAASLWGLRRPRQHRHAASAVPYPIGNSVPATADLAAVPPASRSDPTPAGAQRAGAAT